MEKLKLVTYCGLHCGLCAARGRIPQQAAALRDSMAREGWDQWGHCFDGFDVFWKFLNDRCDLDKSCPGCRQGGGYPDCPIRKCAVERQVDICINCQEYPCDHLRQFNKVYPTLLADGERLRLIGVDAWIAEQEKRAASGFVYADIRYRSNPDDDG